jgi:2-methylcitrate dehydratase PrpD
MGEWANGANMNFTDGVVEFVRDTGWEDLPAAVQHQARRCLLDLVAATLAGTQTPVAGIVAQFSRAHFGGDGATILAGGHRVSAIGAALANGFAANALDIDDGYRRVKGHPGACVLPALLAAAELCREPVTGREFLTDLVIGYEAGIRAGLIQHARYATYHASGSWGAVAAAAVAGRLLLLSPVQLRHALGIAEYHAPIGAMMKGIDKPAMTKDSIGWGAMTGVAAALLAQQGFTGVEPLFSDTPEPAWILSLGDSYEILNLYFKPYACCRWAQPAITGALHLARQYRLAPDEVESISVRTFQAAAQLSRARPQNTEEAQYNLAYPVAAALVDGELGPRQVLPPRIHDPRLLELAGRVAVQVEPAYEALFPAQTLADVAVTTRDGRTLTTAACRPTWEPPDALPSDGELEKKFYRLVEPVCGRARARKIAEAIWQFDALPDARSFLPALSL